MLSEAVRNILYIEIFRFNVNVANKIQTCHFIGKFVISLFSAPVPMESILPPFQLVRDPSGQFLFFPTAVPTAATSIGMLIASILNHVQLKNVHQLNGNYFGFEK